MFGGVTGCRAAMYCEVNVSTMIQQVDVSGRTQLDECCWLYVVGETTRTERESI